MNDLEGIKESVDYYDAVLVTVSPSKAEFFQIEDTNKILKKNDLFNETLANRIPQKQKSRNKHDWILFLTNDGSGIKMSMVKRKALLKRFIEASEL